MDNLFRDKTAKILLVSGSAALRQNQAEVLRHEGFSEIRTAQNLADAIAVMEMDPIDWMITPLFAPNEANALQVLEMCPKYPEMSRLRVTVLVSEEESKILPRAFSMGLFSFQSAATSKEEFQTGIRHLMQTLQESEFNTCLTAAEFLGRHLSVTGRSSELVPLFREVVKILPTSAAAALALARAELSCSLKDNARANLVRAMVLDGKLTAVVNKIAKDNLGLESLESEAKSGKTNILEVRDAVVIDPDESVGSQVEQILRELGVPKIRRFMDGDSAWKELDGGTNEPDLILHEWALASLPGPLLLQRLRAKGFHNVLIVVMSDAFGPDDLPLLREMGVSSTVEKPLEPGRAVGQIIYALQQDRVPTEPKTIELKIRRLLSTKKIDDARPLCKQYMAIPEVSLGMKHLLAAELALAEKNYFSCRGHAFGALQRGGEAVVALNLLGKALIRLGQHETALRCLESAQEISPFNLNRLCDIALSNIQADNLVDAEKAVADAKEIDSENTNVKQAEAACALESGNMDRARKLMGEMTGFANLLSFLNSRAISLTLNNRFREGQDLYQRAIDAVPEGRAAVKATLSYNLGLAFARAGELEKAEKALKVCLNLKAGPVPKAGSLRRKILTSIETNMPLQLVEADRRGEDMPQAILEGAIPIPEVSEQGIRAFLETRRGEVCCRLIYIEIIPDERGASYLKTSLVLKTRKAISRSETSGDWSAKSAS